MPEYLAVCERAVRQAGSFLLERMGRVSVREKGPADLVTEADVGSQELIRQTILQAFPDHLILGEEDQPGTATPDLSGRYRWIVDPLDGTTNFVHQVPFFSVSLALEYERQTLVGAVYHPAADECFTAAAGQGAFLNGRPIRTSGVATMSQALAAIGLPAVVTPESPDLRMFLAALETCQAIRRMGSAALNLCYLAAGRFDASWAFSTKIWDVAAGTLIAAEAGATVSSPDGGGYALPNPHYLAAATPELHKELLQLVRRLGL
jgi:myo-inositol-1(or 4)-monophosphatase